MTKTQVYLKERDLAALHRLADTTGASVAELIREAIRKTWLTSDAGGPVGLWNGPVSRSSVDHDSIYDEP
jgi:hypothetical protein